MTRETDVTMSAANSCSSRDLRRGLTAALLGGACLLLGHVGGAQATDLSAFAACPAEGLPEQLAGKAQCATLTVLEDASRPDGRRLQLPLLKIPTDSQTPGAPVFVLNGGPGEANLGTIRPTGDVQRSRDIYYLGYRGAEGSVVLDCPEIDALVTAPDLLSPASLRRLEGASAACAARLGREGYDLAQYTLFDVIEDLESARAALGLEQINLFSHSYGTRIAQFYARRHPGRIHRSVMTSANPPGHFVFSAYVNDKVLRRLSELCRQDAACAAQTPDVRATVLKAISLRERGESASIDDGRSRLALFDALYGRRGTLTFLKAAVAAEKGDTRPLEQLGAAVANSLPGVIWGDILSKGAVDAYRYAEMQPTLATTATSMGSPMDLLFEAVGAAWPQVALPDADRRAAFNDTETLIINGDLDVATPLMFVEAELMPYLRRGELLTLTDYGHTDYPRLGRSLGQVIARYYDTGVVDRSAFVPDPYSFKPWSAGRS